MCVSGNVRIMPSCMVAVRELPCPCSRQGNASWHNRVGVYILSIIH